MPWQYQQGAKKGVMKPLNGGSGRAFPSLRVGDHVLDPLKDAEVNWT